MRTSSTIRNLEREKRKIITLFYKELQKLSSGEKIDRDILDIYHGAISHTTSVVKQMTNTTTRIDSVEEIPIDLAEEALNKLRNEK